MAQTVKIIYAEGLDRTQLPNLASIIKAEKPALSVFCGDLIGTGPSGLLNQGRDAAQELSMAGVSAVCLTPDLVKLGLVTARYLIDSAAPSMFFLSANLDDTARQGLLGQPYLKTTAGGPKGPLRIAVVGLTADTGSLNLKQPGIKVQAPDEAARRAIALLKMNSDAVGVVGTMAGSPGVPGADFSIPAPTATGAAHVRRIELQLDPENRVVGHKTTDLDIAGAKPDPAVLGLIRSWQTRTESTLNATINHAAVSVDSATLARIIARYAAVAAHCDGALFGNSLKLKPLPAGEITLSRLYEVAGADQPLVRLRLAGSEIDRLARAGGLEIEWRAALRRQRLLMHRDYGLVSTLEYVQTRPELAGYRVEFLPKSVAQVLAEAFRDRSRVVTGKEEPPEE